MLEATAGQLLVNDMLPEDLRDYRRVLDGKTLKALLASVARKYPERYNEISFRLNEFGRRAAQDEGGMSFGLRHLRKSKAARETHQQLQARMQQLLDDDNIDDKSRESELVSLVQQASGPLQKTVYDEALREKNPLARQVQSGTRGKPMNLASLLSSDMLYADHRDQVIPIPVLRSYSEGLSPEEYWAGTYGARRGIIATKFATQQAGFLGKQLNQAAHRLLISDEDREDADDPDQAVRGLPVDTDDSDNEGALLAVNTGPFKRNTPLTPKILRYLKRMGNDKILVRSPIIGGSLAGGVYARDVGLREGGRLPGRGEFVGLQAAQSLAEPVSQGSLCLAAGTLVRMADWTVKPIEHISVGELVMGSDISGRLFAVRVVRTYDNGLRACQRTSFAVASTKERIELVSTGDHKLLANARRWDPKTELVCPGVWPVSEKCVSLCGLMPRKVDHDGGTVQEPLALLLGLLLGDGCYTKSVSGIHLSCFDPTLIEDIAAYLEWNGLRATKLAGHIGYYRISQLQDAAAERDDSSGRFLGGERHPVKQLLAAMNMRYSYAHEKQLPPDVWKWERESLLQLIAGLFATDGSIYEVTAKRKTPTNYLSFCSTSLAMITELRELLRVRFAVTPSPISNQGKNRKRLLYSFVVNRPAEVVRLATLLLPYLPGVKKLQLKEVKPADSKRMDNCYFYRKTQVAIGELPTYDIEVDHPDHLFVLANGLIVSNSAKHSGGVAGQEKVLGGFEYINQLIQIPKVMKGGAAHTTEDGRVSSIIEAPAGGWHVTVNGKKHYVGADNELSVKVGDEVEAGDVISDGMPNPATITQYKGVGEGRRYFVDSLRKTMAASGITANRRNIELLARGLINHVRLTEETDDNVPDDIVPYSTLEHTYKPREGHFTGAPSAAVGQYLEKPVLHYTIGTKLRPSMLKNMEQFGVKSVVTHKDPPPFESEMVRGLYTLQNDPDWMTQMYGSGLQKSLLNATARGATSDMRSTSFVPSLAVGTDFGQKDERQVVKPKADYSLPNVDIPDVDTLPEPTSLMPKMAAVVVPASKNDFSVNLAALQAARDRVNTKPTQAQQAAGNYRKGHVAVNGLSIAIENPKGSTRSGVDAKGKAWSNVMSHDYGYIKGTQGSDGDPVDVFLGPDLDSELVFIIDQDNNGGGVFDEHKCMVGFRNQKDAKAAYLANYDSSWKGLQAITPMPFALFRVWCFSAATKKRAMTKKADSSTPLASSVSKSLPKAPAAAHSSLLAGNAQPDSASRPQPAATTPTTQPLTTPQPAPSAPQPAASTPGATPPAASPAQLRADRIQQSRQPAAQPQPTSTPFGDVGAIKAQIATTLAQEANAFAPGIGGLLTYGAIASPKDLGTLFSSKSRNGSHSLLQTPQTLAEMELPDSIGGRGRFSQQLSPTEQYEADPPPADMGPINDETDTEMPTHHRNTLGINPLDPEGDMNMLPRSLISGTASSLLTPKPPVAPATGGYFSRIAQGAKNLGRAAVSPKAWAQGAKNVGRFAINPETWLPGSTLARQAVAGGAGGGAAAGAGTLLPALGGFTAVNAATELVDAAGLLPEALGGDGLGNFGWDQQGFDQRTMEGGYKPVSNAIEGVMNPLKSIQSIGTGAVEGGAAVAGKARDVVTGTTAKSRAADADFEALKQTEQQRQVQLQQEIHSRQASRHDDPVVAQQIQELETQLADSVQRAEALHDETSTWKTGPGWLGGHSYRDNMQQSHDGLTANIAELMKQKKEGTLPPEDVGRLTRLISRKQNISQLLSQYNRDVGYTSQGDFDQTIRNRVWSKKQHLVELQQRLREPAAKVNPSLRAELAADMQATEEELGQYRRWATQPE